MTTQPRKRKDVRILIVDDEATLLDIYSTKLTMAGFMVITAKDGLEALTTAIQERPDLILLDVVLPIKDGFQVMEDIRANEKTTDIPVIFLSNLGQSYEMKRGLSLGARAFLSKANLTPNRVVEEVDKVLDISE